MFGMGILFSLLAASLPQNLGGGAASACAHRLAEAAGIPDAAEVQSFLESIRGKRVLVVGDVMLDRSRYGTASRISPEAPVPVVDVKRVEDRPGGAGNVALNLKSLGLEVVVAGVRGYDSAGIKLQESFQSHGITPYFLVDLERETTLKERLFADGVHQARADYGSTQALTATQETDLFERIQKHKADVLVLSDYGKGVLTPSFTQKLITWAKSKNIPIIVDPKGTNYSKYSGATILKPNRSEAQSVLGRAVTGSADDLRELQQRFQIIHPLITLSEHGMAWLDDRAEPRRLLSYKQEVFDVTGAGDTVTALLAGGLAAGLSIDLGARMANLAAGIAVSHRGTYSVTPEDLLQSAKIPENKKIVNEQELLKIVHAYQAQGKSIAFTNGVFDLIHVGHIRLLTLAKREADLLIVAINTDASTKRVKGADRPIQNQADRAEIVLGTLADYVILMEDDDPMRLINLIRPDLLVKGGDYRLEEVVGRELVESYGGRVVLSPLVQGRSTQETIQSIKSGSQ